MIVNRRRVTRGAMGIGRVLASEYDKVVCSSATQALHACVVCSCHDRVPGAMMHQHRGTNTDA
eukprot:m.1654348 g.1654348  ORF g.1654348 m.1654348 type:complete len:63 (+) comp101184_c0_seq1:60-248(+)